MTEIKMLTYHPRFALALLEEDTIQTKHSRRPDTLYFWFRTSSKLYDGEHTCLAREKNVRFS